MRTSWITIVSGLPRSGTSMMMAMLAAGGIPPLTDHERRPDQDNPRGYYEFERVKKLPEGDNEWLSLALGKAVKVISALLPHLPPTYSYRVVFMRRNLAEVLASQRQMLASRGETTNDAEDARLAALFERHLEQTEHWLAAQPHMPTLYVSYNALLAQPSEEVERISAFLGGGLDVAAMQRVIDRSLYRQRQPDEVTGRAPSDRKTSDQPDTL